MWSRNEYFNYWCIWFYRYLLSNLLENKGHNVLKFGSLDKDLETKIIVSDAIFHLASVMRPRDKIDFERVNVGLTKEIIHFCIKNN